MTTKFKQFLLFFMVLLLLAGQVMAQDNRAVISGIVTDETGMGVIGAAIQVKNESTGFNTGSITNENGEYTIKQLPLGGPYSITVTYVGYGDQKKTGYTLNQGDLLRLDFQLKEESVVMEAVEVVANSLKNTIATTGAATSVTERDLAKLPVNGRNFTSLVDLLHLVPAPACQDSLHRLPTIPSTV